MADAPALRTSTLRRLLAVAAVAILVLLALAWLNRRTLAREALTGWLQSRGVASRAEVEGLGLTDFTGRLSIGDPARPDFSAERVAVRYRLGWRGFEVTEVRLTRPVLRARVVGGQLRAGALDPLIQEFLRRPPRPDATQPVVEVEDGVLFLATDYGALRVIADAELADGKLAGLRAAVDPARLRLAGQDLALGRTVVSLATRGGVVESRIDAPFSLAGAAGLDAARLSVSATLPYPDFERRRGDGAVTVRADLTGGSLMVGGQALRAPRASLAFTGRATGWIPDLVVAGRASADLGAASAELGPARAGRLSAAVTAADARWSRAGGDRLTATLRMAGGADSLTAGDLRLERLAAAFTGPVAVRAARVDLDLSGSVVGQGGWTGMGPPAAGDAPDVLAMKRALRRFRVAAPAIDLRLSDGVLAAALPAPVDVAPATGGRIRLAARSGALTGPASRLRLTSAGGGLPEVTADLSRLTLAAGSLAAHADLKARLSVGPLVRADLDAAGGVIAGQAGVAFAGTRCAAIKAERLEFGENDLERVSGRFCTPRLRFGPSGWRMAGRAQGIAADIPFLQARIADASAQAAFGGRGSALSADVRAISARVTDAAPAPRFNPLVVTGGADLAGDRWDAYLAARLPDGPSVGTARLTHRMSTGRGGVSLDTGRLDFAEGGLQPVQLTPLAAALGSPAAGQARFAGGFDWSPAGVSSRGEISVPRLDFQSPAGRVTGLSGRIVLTSLAPLTAAPGQALRIESLAGIVPVTDVTAAFGVQDQVLTIAGGEAALGGGRVRIETLEVPLTPGAPMRGVLLFEGVQLHDLVEASPFGDKVDLDAKVSGRLPFEVVETRVRVLGGDLRAIQPGRLSIQREALVGAAAGGATEGVAAAPDASATVADFAYQAMENLAFDTLDAQVRSREDGRLGVLFHIIGKHDPPKRQQIRLSLADLISRNFLGKPLPLPSNTGVNLTLDTTLNLDDLLSDYAEYLRLRGSGPVQP